jgi:hypothetical protein
MNGRLLSAIVLASILAVGPLVSACGRNRIPDSSITQTIDNRLAADADLGEYDVTVTTRDGVVVLTGQVAQDAQRAEAERIALDTPGVERVSNQIQVGSSAPGVPGVGAPPPETGDPTERE